MTRSTSDPKELLESLNRLADPIPTGEGFELQLPEGVAVRPERGLRDTRGDIGMPWPWSLLGALGVLKDPAVGPPMPERALVIFSPGAEGTTITPQDLVDQAVAANVPVYPVAIPLSKAIWYEGESGPLPIAIKDSPAGSRIQTEGQFQQTGACSVYESRGALVPESSLIVCPLNVRFENVGKETNGRSFEAARKPGPKNLLRRPGEPPAIERFSMTGAQMQDILQAVKSCFWAATTCSGMALFS